MNLMFGLDETTALKLIAQIRNELNRQAARRQVRKEEMYGRKFIRGQRKSLAA